MARGGRKNMVSFSKEKSSLCAEASQTDDLALAGGRDWSEDLCLSAD